MQTQITPRRVIEEEIEVLNEKPLHDTLSNNGLLRVLSSLVIWIPQFRPIASTIQRLLPILPKGTKISLNTQGG